MFTLLSLFCLHLLESLYCLRNRHLVVYFCLPVQHNSQISSFLHQVKLRLEIQLYHLSLMIICVFFVLFLFLQILRNVFLRTLSHKWHIYVEENEINFLYATSMLKCLNGNFCAIQSTYVCLIIFCSDLS